MMKNQRLLRLLALLFSFTLIAAACGGDDDGDATGDDTSACLLYTSDAADDCSHALGIICLLYTSPSPRDKCRSRMPSSA